MRRRDVKRIIAYYFEIPAMRAELAAEREELEDEYNGLHGTACDGMPHGSMLRKPTEELAIRTDARNVRDRLEALSVLDHVLTMDKNSICCCIDVLKIEYKRLILARYKSKYSWARIATTYNAPERTVHWWHDKAIDRLGEALEEMPMVDEILGRASRARD